MSILRLGDIVLVNLAHPFPPHEEGYRVLCRVDAFRTRPSERVHVVAARQSDDPLVDNDWWVPYGAIRQ